MPGWLKSFSNCLPAWTKLKDPHGTSFLTDKQTNKNLLGLYVEKEDVREHEDGACRVSLKSRCKIRHKHFGIKLLASSCLFSLLLPSGVAKRLVHRLLMVRTDSDFFFLICINQNNVLLVVKVEDVMLRTMPVYTICIIQLSLPLTAVNPYRHTFQHNYEFMSFRSGTAVSEQVFQIPPGIVCSGRSDNKPLPPIPDQLEMSMEVRMLLQPEL